MLYKLLQGIVKANKKLLIFFMNNKLIPKPDKKWITAGVLHINITHEYCCKKF